MKRTDAGAKRRRIAPVLLLAALSALAGVLPPTSAGQDPNTWSGTWVNSAPDGSFWVFSQSGATVGGVWKGNASSGTLSGTVSGSNLSGTFVNNEQSLSASFSITLAADGHSFSGTFTVVGGSTGQWRSACSGGACLANAAPAPAATRRTAAAGAINVTQGAGRGRGLGANGAGDRAGPRQPSDRPLTADRAESARSDRDIERRRLGRNGNRDR